MVDMEVNLKELCTRIVHDLENCTNQDKKDAYAYLDLKVKATPTGADIKGYLDTGVIKSSSCLLTTGQTSACLSGHNKINIPFRIPVEFIPK
jgi:site-specific DNA recombinase